MQCQQCIWPRLANVFGTFMFIQFTFIRFQHSAYQIKKKDDQYDLILFGIVPTLAMTVERAAVLNAILWIFCWHFSKHFSFYIAKCKRLPFNFSFFPLIFCRVISNISVPLFNIVFVIKPSITADFKNYPSWVSSQNLKVSFNCPFVSLLLR